MLYHIFGKVVSANGLSAAGNKLYTVADVVSGNVLFESGVVFNGIWCFDIFNNDEEDHCEIIGEKANISFSFFDKQDVTIIKDGKIETLPFEKPVHAQQPFLGMVVNYFLNKGENPCTIKEAVEVMKLMEAFTSDPSSSIKY